MPMRPRSGSSRVVRHRKSWSSSSALGCLKLKTWQPCGLTPDITCLMTPSLPPASIAWKMTSSAWRSSRVVKPSVAALSSRNVILQNLLILRLRLIYGINLRRPLIKIDLVSLGDAKVLGLYVHRLRSIN